MIIVNTKNYLEEKELKSLIKKIEKVNKNIIVAVPAIYLKEISKNTKLNIYAQHLDPVLYETTTGAVIPKMVKKIGVKGSLINHSEYQLLLGEVKIIVEQCKKYDLKSIVCASDLREVKQIIKFNPTAIAFEDPKLISSGKSITTFNPSAIIKFVSLLSKTNIIPLCGAGISTQEDVKSAKKLGCKGVLIASAIAKETHPEKLLKSLSILN